MKETSGKSTGAGCAIAAGRAAAGAGTLAVGTVVGRRETTAARRGAGRESAAVWMAASASGLLVLLGCGIFDTRTPEEPQGPDVPFVTPVDRESVVLTNLEVTLEAKSTINYERSLYDDGEDTFYYLPPPAEDADWNANFPDGYSRSDELNVITTNLAAEGELDVTWGAPAEPVPGSEDGVTEIRNLTYQFVFTNGEVTKTYSGTCNLLFREGDGFQLSGIEDLGGNADNWTRLRLRRSDVYAAGGFP
jgi:hypothetical protein